MNDKSLIDRETEFKLEKAMGALAEIATNDDMSKEEIQHKAQRIYDEVQSVRLVPLDNLGVDPSLKGWMIDVSSVACENRRKIISEGWTVPPSTKEEYEEMGKGFDVQNYPHTFQNLCEENDETSDD